MKVGVDARALLAGRGVARFTRGLLAALAEGFGDDEWLAFVPGRAPVAAGPPARDARAPPPRRARAVRRRGGGRGARRWPAWWAAPTSSGCPPPPPSRPAPRTCSPSTTAPGSAARTTSAPTSAPGTRLARPRALARGAAAVTADSHAVAAELRAAWGVQATVVSPGRRRRPSRRPPRPAAGATCSSSAPTIRARPRRRSPPPTQRAARAASTPSSSSSATACAGSTTPSWPRSTPARWPWWRPSYLEGFGLVAARGRRPRHARRGQRPRRASPRRWATPRCACRSATPARWPTRCCASRGDDALRARLGAAARERAALYTWERAAAALHPLLARGGARELHDRHRPARLGARAGSGCCPRCASTCPPTPSSWSSTRARATTGPRWRRAAGAEVIVLDGNPGFGAASNAGVAAARHDVTVLLNPDCELLDAGLAELAAARRGRRGAARPAADRGRRSAAAQRAPAAGRARWRSCAPCCPRARCPSPTARADRGAWAGRSPPAWPRRPRCCAAWAPSTPSAFLFYEDMDLCLRAHAAGVPTVLHPEVVVRHLGGRSTARAFGGEAFDLQARRRREVVGARLGRAGPANTTTARRP